MCGQNIGIAFFMFSSHQLLPVPCLQVGSRGARGACESLGPRTESLGSPQRGMSREVSSVLSIETFGLSHSFLALLWERNKGNWATGKLASDDLNR